MITRHARFWASIAFITACVETAFAAPTVVGYQLVSKTISGRTTMDYTYRIQVQNDATALKDVGATVVSSNAATVIIDNSVTVGALAASTLVTTVDTFSLRQDRLKPFEPTALVWTLTGTPAVGPPPSGDGFLPGAPADNAIGAMADFFSKESFTDSDLAPDPELGPVFLSALEIVLTEAATVGNINDALHAFDARIISMVEGSGRLMIRVPRQGNVAAIKALASEIAKTPGVREVNLDTPLYKNLLPPNYSGTSVDARLEDLAAVGRRRMECGAGALGD